MYNCIVNATSFKKFIIIIDNLYQHNVIVSRVSI